MGATLSGLRKVIFMANPESINVWKLYQKWIVIIILIYFIFLSFFLRADCLWIDEMWAADLIGNNIFPKLFSYSQFTKLSESLKEILTKIYILGGAAQIVLRSAISDTSPPVYYLFMHLWTSLFGVSEFALRMPSLLFQLGSLLIILALIRNLRNEIIAFLMTILIMSNSLQIYLATDARPYAIYQFLILLFLFLLKNELNDVSNSRSRMMATFVVAVLAMYTHYMACLFIAGGLILVFHQKIIAKNDVGWRTFLPPIAAIVIFSFWLPAIYLQTTKTGRLGYLSTFDITALSDLFYWACPISIFFKFNDILRFWVGIGAAILWVISCYWVWINCAKDESYKVIRWLTFFQISVMILIFLLCFIKPIYSAKNFSVLSVLTPLPMLAWIHSKNSKILNNLMMVCAIFFLISFFGLTIYRGNLSSYYMAKPEWDKTADYIAHISYKYDKILINPQFERSPFMYYFKHDGYSVDDTRADKILKLNNVNPLYGFSLTTLSDAPDYAWKHMYGERLLLIDSDNNPPESWRRHGFYLAKEFKGVRVYTLKEIP